ncbi:MAG: AmmeMemoRadiSam system radical SAM enzyme [Nanoarchaeota archaeon]|nr:AmmeMemoRadiSam system radical SAM enzyme [Nanoarchaeota archaeon]
MKEAMYYKKLTANKVKCLLCPHFCLLSENKKGLCRVRKNNKGKLYSLIYNKPCSVNIDPIEKKPLYHFHPASKTLSIGTNGCNLLCLNCQNYEISKEFKEIKIKEVKPEEIIEIAKKNNCKSISYTYTEPTIFYEYMLDIARLAKKSKIKSVIVSNGYINEDPLKELIPYLDAVNIDLKAFNENFYTKNCNAQLEPVLNTLKLLKKSNIWIEITNLIIPRLSDNQKEIEKMCQWIRKNLGNIPIHFSRFYPYYKLDYIQETPLITLRKASNTAKKYLDYVYIGNILTDKEENTYCPKCQSLIIERHGFEILKNNLKSGKCSNCKKVIPGIWD